MTDTAPAHRLELDDLGDKLESFYVLRKTNSEEASAVLDQLGANSTVDRDIVLELASKRPLGHPDRFWEAHTMAVRALEVLDRNGTRSMPAPKWLGPLGAVPKYLVGIVVGFVVKSHLRSVIDNLRRSGSTDLLTTSDDSSSVNADIVSGDFRPINRKEIEIGR